MSGSSRKDSGAGSKSRYQSLNLAQNYKGSGHDYRSTAQKRGSMQSLGKIPTTARRMPVPAQLRSLKSSNDGQDPSVALVPQGGGGWSKDEEKEREKEDPRNYTRKTEKQPDPSIPEEFKSDFPTLKEQEKMSKKEQEELKKKQREDSEQQKNEGGASPPNHSACDHHPRKPEEVWRGSDTPPYQQGTGQGYNMPPSQFYPPHRQAMYPPPPYPPTSGGRYPSRGPHPPHHPNSRYRHTHPYPPPSNFPPSHDPYNYHDPYSLPSNVRERNVPREDGGAGHLHPSREGQQEMEEDDEGWAGHQEEVDYTKEVVFEDSSDEDSPKKANKEHGKKEKRFDKENDPPTLPTVLPTDGLMPGQEPYYEPRNKRGEGPMRDHSHRRHPPSSGYHPRGHPPYVPYEYPHHGHPYHTHPPPPPHAWYPHYTQREEYIPDQSGPTRHWKSEKEEKAPGRGGGRYPVSSSWGSEGVHQAKRRNDPPKDERGTHSETGTERPVSRTPSGDKTSPMGSFDSNRDSNPTPDPLPPATPSPDNDPSSVRNYPRRIMTRDLPPGRPDNGGHVDQQTGQKNPRMIGQEPLEGGPQKPKVAWGGVASGQAMSQPVERVEEEDVPSPTFQPSQTSKESFQGLDRGRITTPKTLYEPEGRTSEEKFRKYQRSMSGGGGEHHAHPKPKTSSSSSGSKGDHTKGEGLEVRSASRQDETSNQGNQYGAVFGDEEEKLVVMKREESSALDQKDETKSRRDGQSRGRRDGRRDQDMRGGKRREGDDVQRSAGHGEKGMDRRKVSTKDEPVRGGREATERGGGGGHGGLRPQPHSKRDKRLEHGSDQGRNHPGPGPNVTRTVQRQNSRLRGKAEPPRNPEQERGMLPPRSRSLSDSQPDSVADTKDRPTRNQHPVDGHNKPDTRQEREQRPVKSVGKHQDTRPAPPTKDTRPPPSNKDSRPPPSTNISHQDQSSKSDQVSGHRQHEAMPTSGGSGRVSLDPPVASDKQSVPVGPDSKHEPRHPQRKTQSRRFQGPSEAIDGRGQRKQDSSKSVPRRAGGGEPVPPRQDLKPSEELRTADPVEKRRVRPSSRQDPKTGSKDPEPVPESSFSSGHHQPITEKSLETNEGKTQQGSGLHHKRLPSDEEESPTPKEQRGNKRRLNMREREEERGRRRPRSGRGGGRTQRYEDDDNDSYNRPIRRSNRVERGGDSERYQTRMFGGSRRDGRVREGGVRASRGGGRGENLSDNRHGPEVIEGGTKEEGRQKRSGGGRLAYTDLDEIDSPEDWDEEEETLGNQEEEDKDGDVKPPVNKRRPQEGGATDRPRDERRRDNRGRGVRPQDRSRGRRRRHDERDGFKEQRPNPLLPDPQPIPPIAATTKKEEDKPSATSGGRSGGTLQQQQHPDPPKDHNFEKYDINAHNVVVVDQRVSDTEEGDGQSLVTAEEGFIEVKSKKEKQKDREERRRMDGSQQKRGEEDSSRHRGGALGRSQEHGYQAGKGWGQMQQRKVETRDSNEDWPINEGKSVFGAVGEKPSKDRGKDTHDSHKTTNPNPNPGYKLFETEKGPFSFNPPPLAGTPRKGERFLAAIESTLPSSPQVRTTLDPSLPERGPNAVGSSRQGLTQPSSKTIPATEVCISSTAGPRNTRETRPRNGGVADEPHPRNGRGEQRADAAERGRNRKPKTEQKYYTPPGARQEDRTSSSRAQRPQQSSKQQNMGEIGAASSGRSKVHRQGFGEERSEDREEPLVEQEQERNPREVYLQQHQDIGGHMIVVGGDTASCGGGGESVSGDIHSDKPHFFHSIGSNNNNSQKKMASTSVMKNLQNMQRPIPVSQSATKFGSVSYASALKMKAQLGGRAPSKGGVTIEDNTAVALLGSELSHLPGKELMISYSDDSETDMGVAKDEILQLHDVLDPVVLPNEEKDEDEIEGDGRDRRTSSGFSPSIIGSDDTAAVRSLYIISGGVDRPLSLSPSSKFTKPMSPPHSSVGGGSPSSIPSQSNPSNSPSFSQVDERAQCVKKLMKEDSARPSSAQSLTDQSYPSFTVSALAHLNSKKSPSPVDKGSSVPLTRVSSAPSNLPLASLSQPPDGNDESNDEDTESVRTDDSLSTSSKSLLNIAANEFVPRRPLSRKRQGRDNPSKPGRVYQGGRGGGRGGAGNVQAHTQHPKHKSSHPIHFQQHHHHAHSQNQIPHPPHQQQQQQPLINKPPAFSSSLQLLQLLFQKNIPPSVLFSSLGISGVPLPSAPLSTPQTLSHPSLPLSYPPPPAAPPLPPPPGNISFQLTHPGVLTPAPPPPHSRKISAQEGVANPHVMPHPPMQTPTATPIQYIPTGSKGSLPEGAPELSQVPNLLAGQVSTSPHPSYYSATPLHPSPAPPPPPPAVLVPSHHSVQVHPMSSARPSPRITPINTSQVHPPPPTAPHSLSLARPGMVEQQGNSNSRPPLLPTPPGFSLVHQTSAVSTPSVTTPPSTMHHGNWSMGIRMGLPPPAVQSHDQSSLMQYHPRIPPTNSV